MAIEPRSYTVRAAARIMAGQRHPLHTREAQMLTVCATGRLGRDAETRTTQGGAQVTGFSLAVDGYEGGEKITTWLKCAMWGERGAKVAPMLRKGTSVSIVGVGSLASYTGKDGAERIELAVRVDQWTFAGPRQDAAPASPSAPQGGGFSDDGVSF